MAENKEFIREVDEEYRREQILKVWRRYNGVIIAFVVLVVAGVAGWRYWQMQQHAAAEAASVRFDAANRLAHDGKTEEADKAFTGLEQEGTAGYRLLARFRAAAETTKTDPAKGADAFDALAGDTAIGTGLSDLARLRAALIRMDGPNPDAALANLQSLAAGSPYRHTAREMLGLASLKKGDYEEASRWFDQIVADPDTPRSLRERIEVYAAIVAGGPVTVTAAKSEPAAPPPPTIR